MGFPHSSVGKESACNAGDPGLIPGSGRSAGEDKGYPLHYSGLENSMDCIVHGVTNSRHNWVTFTSLPFTLCKLTPAIDLILQPCDLICYRIEILRLHHVSLRSRLNCEVWWHFRFTDDKVEFQKGSLSSWAKVTKLLSEELGCWCFRWDLAKSPGNSSVQLWQSLLSHERSNCEIGCKVHYFIKS